jgi:hypothetical protein
MIVSSRGLSVLSAKRSSGNIRAAGGNTWIRASALSFIGALDVVMSLRSDTCSESVTPASCSARVSSS